MMKFRKNLFMFAFLTAAVSLHAQAQEPQKEEILPEKRPEETAAKADASIKQGWMRRLSLGLVGQYSDSENVTGKPNGNSSTLGTKDNLKMNLVDGQTEWRNELDLVFTNSRSTALPRTIKSEDSLKVETIYLFRLASMPQVGPYARANVQTQMADGYDERASDVTYVVSDLNGGVQTTTDDRLKLTDGFRPTTTKLSLGGFYEIIRSVPVTAEYRLGAGYRHFAANGQYVVRDVASTPEIEVFAIETNKQFGAETGLTVGGDLMEKKVTYKLNGEVLVPYWERPKPEPDNKTPMERKITEVTFDLALHVMANLSLNYQMKSVRDPAVNDKAQTTQSVLANLSYVYED